MFREAAGRPGQGPLGVAVVAARGSDERGVQLATATATATTTTTLTMASNARDADTTTTGPVDGSSFGGRRLRSAKKEGAASVPGGHVTWI